VILRIFNDGRMAAIILDPTAEPLSADELLQLMRTHGVTAAKIIRTQTAQESPPPRFGTQVAGEVNLKRTEN
jgi:hypothetical protein